MSNYQLVNKFPKRCYRLSRDRELSEIYKLAVKNDVPASNTGHEKLNIE
jgi:hypothetical protein